MDSPPGVASRQAMAIIGGLFYVTGGLAAVFVGLWAPVVDHRGWLELVGVLSVVFALCAMRFAKFVTRRARCLMNLAATALILLLVVLGGHTDGAEALFWLFVYVPMDSFFFFAWRTAIPLMVWAACATALAAFVAHVISPAEWCVLSTAGLVASLAIGWLVRSASAAQWDPGASMLGRVGFFRRLDARCGDAAQRERRVSLAVVNVDRIDRLIATRGRPAVELMLRRLATAWTTAAPDTARWGRLQDHEFAVLWDNGPGFEDYLETVRAAAASINTVSIGLADSDPSDTSIQLLTKALVGVAYSERSGGNLVTRHGLVAEKVDELSAAIAAGQIAVFYQPIVTIGDGRICGAEALARWIHPTRGVIRAR